MLFAASAGSEDSRPISDQGLRLVALHAIFPGMQIDIEPGKKINDASPDNPNAGELYFPDALAGEVVYRVSGEAMNKVESCASTDAASGRHSDVRELRFRLFRWPSEADSDLLAVLQYDFPSGNPAMSCPSIGLLVHLARNGPNWSVRERYLLETIHHGSIQAIRLLDLTGRGADELLIESDFGGAGTAASSLQIFDLSKGNLDEVLATESRMQNMTDDWYTQVLDIGRTRKSNGQQVCFSKTTLFQDGEAFRPPRVSRPCYKRGEGISARAITELNNMLLPLR